MEPCDDRGRDAPLLIERPPPWEPVATVMSHRKFKSPPAHRSDGTDKLDRWPTLLPTDALPEARALETLTRPKFVVGVSVLALLGFVTFFSSFPDEAMAFRGFSPPRSKKAPISGFGRSVALASGASGRPMEGAQPA